MFPHQAPKNIEKQSQNWLPGYPETFPHQRRSILSYLESPKSHVGQCLFFYFKGLRPGPPIRTLAPGPPGASSDGEVPGRSRQRPSPGLKPWPLQWPDGVLTRRIGGFGPVMFRGDHPFKECVKRTRGSLMAWHPKPHKCF